MKFKIERNYRFNRIGLDLYVWKYSISMDKEYWHWVSQNETEEEARLAAVQYKALFKETEFELD